MKIRDLLSESSVDLHVSANSKKDVLDTACQLMAKNGNIKDPAAYKKAVLKREKESTTGTGEGIAIPHAKGEFVSKPGLAAMVIKDGVDYDSLDGEPVKLLFLIAAPDTKDNIHLEVLSNLSKILLDEKIVKALLGAKSKKEFINILSAEEEKRAGEKAAQVAQKEGDSYDILAVTSCPTGIAHTYMAEEAIKKACEKKNLKVKVETNGASGVQNLLTAKDIDNAKGIIIAADIGVPMDRFNGKRLVQVSVSKAISSADKLVDDALEGKGSIYHASGDDAGSQSDSSSEKDTVWHTIYKHLMAGVSHMLPFVIGGGILIAIAFLIDGLAGNAGAGSSFGSVNVVASWFKSLGGYAFGFMIPILAGFIAYSIAGTPGLLIGFVGGALATVSDFSIGNSLGIDTSATAGFIGALFAGFAGGYLVIGLKKLFKFMPKSMDGIKPMLIYPVLGTLGIGLFMYLMNTPFQYINVGFNDMLNWLGSKNLVVLLGAILATMMATDMGGPINKAAYMFGTAMLTQAASSTDPTYQSYCYILMGCVMIGGMVPPLAIALATNLFPQKWSRKERHDGKVNYIMGLSFITEGAIPYAASYPLPVIGSSMVGSCVAGILSALFKCELMAPHGGIFVFPVVTGWYWYLIALAIGSFVGAIMLGITMKNNPNPELKGKWKGLFNVHTGEKKN
ncbi:MAG: fructose-specific PTS transporter subunit EIIC [Bacilli bacterium]